MTWRGRTREQLLAHLAAPSVPRSTIAPWWPLVPGARLPEPPLEADVTLAADPPAEATAVLQRCEPLDVDVRGVPITDLLDPAYEALRDPADP